MFKEHRKLNPVTFLIAFGTLLVITLFSGCASEPRAPEAFMDTPEHHYNGGVRLFDQGKIEEAEREFNLALQLVKGGDYGPGHAGLGWVEAHRKNFDAALDHMKKARSAAKTDPDRVIAAIGFIRLYTIMRQADEARAQKLDWLIETRDHYNEAVRYGPDNAELHYRMGVAYKVAYEFRAAAEMFRKVIDLDKTFTKEANQEWETVQKIVRAEPGTLVGKRIALVDEISRADIAALFVEELRLDKLYARKKTFDTSFQPPEEKTFYADWISKAPDATDIQNHVLHADIRVFLDSGVRGLEAFPDHRWLPDRKIRRAEYAMLVEDVLIRVNGDDSLATKFIGAGSPFPDLRNDLPYFNAVMLVTTRGIMKSAEMSTGEFQPQGTVSGADALLIIRELKNALKL